MTQSLKASTVNGPTSAIALGDWDSSPNTAAFWSGPLTSGTLAGAIKVNVVGIGGDPVAPACEIAVTNGDGSSPTVVGYGTASLSMADLTYSITITVFCRTTTITAGQRLRFRFFIDDSDADGTMVSGSTAQLVYESSNPGSIEILIPTTCTFKFGKIQQQDYRWRDDDDSESAATWLENENTSHEFNLAGSPGNAKARLRFEVRNLGSPSVSVSSGFLLELQRAMPASSPETRVPYDFSSFVDSGDSYSSGDDDLAGINDTGTVFFTIRESNDTVYDHTCTAYDLTSASSGGDSLSCATQTGALVGGVFSPDGTKLFAFCGGAKSLYRYSGTAWDLSTFSYDTGQTYSSSEGTGWYGLAFSPDGLIAYQRGSSVDDAIYQHTLTTAWDLTSASYASKSIALPGNAPLGFVSIIAAGKILITGGSNDASTVAVYILSTPYDVSTATYLGDYAGGWNHGVADFFTDNGTQRWTHSSSGTTVHSVYTSTQSDWFSLTTGIYAKAFDSTNLTDEADTTVQMGGSPYLSNNDSVTEDGVSATTELAAGQHAEIEFTVEFIADDLSDGETVRFRLKGADSYS